MLKTYLYIVELIRAVLDNRKPEEKPEDVSWENIVHIAKAHMVISLVQESAMRLQKQPDGKIQKTWKEFSDKALVKEISFDAERESILSEFEKAQIKYLPLKGIIIKQFYTRPGLRQFSDNDILYDSERQQDVKNIMLELGYEGDASEANHDVYEKQPIYNYELHTRLLPNENKSSWYFKDIWNRAIKDENNEYGYHMSDLDFYLYHIVHLEKHFGGSGTGLRYFVDQYYLNKNMVVNINPEELKKGLDALQMTSFEQKINQLTEALFAKKTDWQHLFDENEELEQMFLFVMSCGAYGSFDNLVQNRMKKYDNKFKYFLSRLTCEDEYLRDDYPILKKAPYLKPVFVVWRLIRAPFKKTDRVKAELRGLFNRKGK